MEFRIIKIWPKTLRKYIRIVFKRNLGELSFELALTYGELVTRLKGKEIDAIDSMIASVALATGKLIVTRNIKHFDRTGVGIEPW